MLIVPNWIIIAVLFLAASLFPRFSSQHSQSPARSHRHPGNNHTDLTLDWSQEGEELMSVEAGSRWLSHREAQLVLRREGGEKGLPVDCCPSTLEMVEPQGGINQDGMLVELYSEIQNTQRFYELSCRAGVEGKPCRFLDRRLHNQSKCVQKYSYTYAIVRDDGTESSARSAPRPQQLFPSATGYKWRLDYIRVRSGCSCEITPRVRRRRAKSKRNKGRRSEEET
ncbi:uncharacterized protein LOC124366014 [Homalodisca vitripennis]|uniref:uncharacterized protein LOC124366014 n=1 Tax=Homalodisca vitripennis TaxID=197043 RepID=UPI001EEB0B00|nr:uncharacterized protein LOC124366014 [Homalodisca vitripennis]